MPGWKWYWKKGAWGYYSTPTAPSYDELASKVKDLLGKASKGALWRDPRGVPHIPIIVDGHIIGEIWEDVDLKILQPGGYWAGKWGYKVQLVKDGRVVGFIWLPY
jgi:hypothetical protein